MMYISSLTQSLLHGTYVFVFDENLQSLRQGKIRGLKAHNILK